MAKVMQNVHIAEPEVTSLKCLPILINGPKTQSTHYNVK